MATLMTNYYAILSMLTLLNFQIVEQDSLVMASFLTQADDPCLSIAIGMQESGLRNVEGPTDDYGYFQLTHYAMYGHSKEEVLGDVGLQTLLHLRHLKEKKKQCKHLDDEWWTCYHSKTPKFRLKYRDQVNKYRRQLNEQFGKTCERITNQSLPESGDSPKDGGNHSPQPPSTTAPKGHAILHQTDGR